MLPVVLAILDGWGVAPRGSQADDATVIADTPFLREMSQHYPRAVLKAAGEAVGLPRGQDGNSEAGHLNLGAGRIVAQDSVIISKSIRDGTFFKNQAFRTAIEHVKAHRSALHLMGLLSNYNSGHSSPDHFIALLKLLQQQCVRPVYLHFFTDGRDSAKYDAIKFLGEVKKRLRNGEVVATLCGRFYSMDRKKEWSRTALTYDLLTRGRGRKEPSAEVAVRHAYNRGESDEYLSPTVITDSRGRPRGLVRDNDAVIFFNLRSDRARQLAKPFVQQRFERLNKGAPKRWKILKNLCFVALTDFGPDLGNILTVFPSRDVKNSLPMALKGFRQLYVAESEKFAH
ncbi:MAG: 2,3-bisphosphoglycerate-independent phosphoglycerate mutase, partial [Candidatus Veblenbacteria bacterium]|nr:2,3-bisphosphoglycerate-independent phosphoglycerate mutase [Candidatus Veblenbacteria bacterium]